MEEEEEKLRRKKTQKRKEKKNEKSKKNQSSYLGVHLVVDLVLVHAQVQDDVRRALGHLKLALGPLDRRFRALDLRVERHEVEVLVRLEALEVGGAERHRVERVARGLPPLGGHGGGLEGLLHVVALHPGGAVV